MDAKEIDYMVALKKQVDALKRLNAINEEIIGIRQKQVLYYQRVIRDLIDDKYSEQDKGRLKEHCQRSIA